MNNPSPNNNNNKKMSSSLALALAAKQGPKKPQVTRMPMLLLTNRKLSTLAGDSSMSSSSSLMKRPSLLLPKKNGGKLGDSKFNSLLTKRPINTSDNNSNSNNQKKKIVIRDQLLIAPFAVGASRSNGSGGELCVFVLLNLLIELIVVYLTLIISSLHLIINPVGRSSVAASVPVSRQLSVVGDVKKKRGGKASFKRNDKNQCVTNNGKVHKSSTDENKEARASLHNANITAGTFHLSKDVTKSTMLLDTLKRAAEDPNDWLHGHCAPKVTGDFNLRRSPDYYIHSHHLHKLASDCDFTSDNAKALFRNFMHSYGNKSCRWTGKSSIQWSETAEQKKKKGGKTNAFKNGTKLWFTIHRPTFGPHM